MLQRMIQRCGTFPEWVAANPILEFGELGVEQQPAGKAPRFKIGDGITPWVNLQYVDSAVFERANILYLPMWTMAGVNRVTALGDVQDTDPTLIVADSEDGLRQPGVNIFQVDMANYDGAPHAFGVSRTGVAVYRFPFSVLDQTGQEAVGLTPWGSVRSDGRQVWFGSNTTPLGSAITQRMNEAISLGNVGGSYTIDARAKFGDLFVSTAPDPRHPVWRCVTEGTYASPVGSWEPALLQAPNLFRAYPSALALNPATDLHVLEATNTTVEIPANSTMDTWCPDAFTGRRYLIKRTAAAGAAGSIVPTDPAALLDGAAWTTPVPVPLGETVELAYQSGIGWRTL